MPVTSRLLALRKKARRRQLVAMSEVTRDWRTTWKVNAVADAWVMEHERHDIPSNFVLRIEENRMVRDIGVGEVMETRWRSPTKAEGARSCAAITRHRRSCRGSRRSSSRGRCTRAPATAMWIAMARWRKLSELLKA